MKKIYTVFALLLLLLFIATGCEKERMEGTLVIKMDRVPDEVVADPRAYIYNIAHLDDAIATVHFGPKSKEAEITLNVGDYAVDPIGWHMYPKKFFQIRQGQTTVVEYKENK